MLPIERCRFRTTTINQFGISLHTHTTTSEIIQTHDSVGKIIINDKVYEMQPNALFFIHGLSPHFVLPENMERYNHSLMILNTFEIERLCTNLDMNNEYRTVFQKNGGSFCLLSDKDSLKVAELFLEAQQTINDDKEMKYGRLTVIFTKLLQIGYENTVAKETTDTTLARILSLINNNIESKISIDDLSRECNLSKYYMCRLFKEKMGVTIGDFIKGQRISCAKQLLINTSLSINAIAHQCGFSDGNFFTKVFSSAEACTPTAFRKKHK